MNPDYVLRHDLKRTFIISKNLIKHNSEPNWISVIHPVHAMILSFFTRKLSFKTTLKLISQSTGEKVSIVNNLIQPFICNKKQFAITFHGLNFKFPKNIIIPYNENIMEVQNCRPGDFRYNALDFDSKRMFSGPLSVSLMLNNLCSTNCVYCYADKREKFQCEITLERFKNIVKEAKQLNIVDFGLSGGEIFLTPNWSKFLKILLENDYYPDVISTKLPLTPSQIHLLKNLNINKVLQISLDSVNVSILTKMLNVDKSYLHKIIQTIRIIDYTGIKFKIATTLTRYNDSYSNVLELLNFIKQFPNIIDWDIGPAFDSLYKEKQTNVKFKSSRKKLQKVQQFVLNQSERYHFNINFDSSYLGRPFYNSKEGGTSFPGSECSANKTHMIILPDGNVTCCEQFYWMPQFLLGNINDSTIADVWLSDKALNLFDPKYISKNSNCAMCSLLNDCYSTMNKCWVDIIKAYGIENWDYPDPRCFFAPKMFNDLAFN